MIDLRSDTVTRPTPAMRDAVARAEVGDDCFGEDPTVRRLEERAAEILGKERALYFPSGIMANQTGVLALARPGSEVLCEAGAHILHYEEASIAAHGGLMLRAIRAAAGVLTAEELRTGLKPASRYYPETSVLCLENTHLDSGGRVMGPERTAELAAIARDAGLAVHLDGARLWNAAVAAGAEPAELTASVDTVMTCLSKGLGAPVGSVLAGSHEVIERGWRIRRRLGGQMRQAGMIAAAGLYALERHRERVSDDHRRARVLAEGAGQIAGLRVTPPETNIVMLEISESGKGVGEVLTALEERGVRMVPFGATRIRAVLHLEVGDEEVDRAVEALREVFG